MDYKDSPKQEYSFLGKIHNFSKLNDEPKKLELQSLLSQEIRNFINFVDNKDFAFELISQCLETIKNILDEHFVTFEDFIPSQFISSLLFFLKFISLDSTEQTDSDNESITVKMQLIIFEILKILSNGSNVTISNIIFKNQLFPTLFSIAETFACPKNKEQIRPYLEVFHLYFQPFNKVSDPFPLPPNVISTLNNFANFSLEPNLEAIVPSLIQLYEDFLINLELSENDMVDIYTILCILLINYDVTIYKSVESLLKHLLQKGSLTPFLEEFKAIVEFYIYHVKNILSQGIQNKESQFQQSEDIQFPLSEENQFPRTEEDQLEQNEENRIDDIKIGFEICSIIDSAYQNLLKENSQQGKVFGFQNNEEDDDELDSTPYHQTLLDTFDIQLLLDLLKLEESRTYDVSSIFRLISYHLSYNVQLEDFVEHGGYDLIIEFLNDTPYEVVKAVLSLLYSMSVTFGWQAMPENAFLLFIETCSEILSDTDAQFALLFMNGFINAVNSGLEYRSKAISLYHQFDVIDPIVSSLASNESDEVAEKARYICQFINSEV